MITVYRYEVTVRIKTESGQKAGSNTKLRSQIRGAVTDYLEYDENLPDDIESTSVAVRDLT